MYVDAQPLCMRVHSVPTDPNIYEAHWYVHDRLGSVRQVVKLNEFSRAQVENRYAYTPFGEDLAAVTAETIANPFQFTGQWHDAEIGQYHLRARMYDPAMMRFTGRDPVRGGPNEPLTLHRYLYCVNDPPNRVDPSGKLSAANLVSGVITGYSLYGHGVSLAAYAVDTGDDRFWELAQTTFEFIPYALTYASVNFTGPLTNILKLTDFLAWDFGR